ncbi:MAG: PEP-CTERM sorting domain-containing protein [Thermoguttaceae bacterium]
MIPKTWVFWTLFTGCLVHASAAATINVGPGQTYTDVQSAVSAASAGDSVHVHAGTYVISSSITISKNIKLYGDGADQTKISVTSASVCNSSSQPGYIYLNGASGAEVCSLAIIGPASGPADQWGTAPTNYRNGIWLSNCKNVNIHDIYETELYADGVKMASGGSSDVNIYNMKIDCDNHDGVQIWSGNRINISNCYISTINNCCVRFANTQNSRATRITGTFGYGNSGWTAIEFEGTLDNITVDHSVFLNGGDNYWAAVVTGSEAAQGNASLHDNMIYNVPKGYSLALSGFTPTLSNNTVAGSIDPNCGANGYGYVATPTPEPSSLVLAAVGLLARAGRYYWRREKVHPGIAG